MLMLAKSAGALVALYLVAVLLIALAQDWLLFPRWMIPPGTAALPAPADRLSIELPNGDQLAGVFLPGENPPPDAALVLGFGGNAWDADVLATHLHSLFPDRDVVTFHYRGYGPSTGRPTARALLADAVRVYDEVAADQGPQRIVAVGVSLGSGPAAHLATQRRVAGLILVTPFDSLVALAGDLYPWLPVRPLLRHRMDVADALAKIAAPVAVIAAESDRVVPPRRTAALRRAANGLVLDRVVAGAGHINIYDHREYVAAMRKALELIEAVGEGR